MFNFSLGTCDGNLVSLNSNLQDIGEEEQTALTWSGFSSDESRIELHFRLDDIKDIALIQFEISNVEHVTVVVDVIGSNGVGAWVRHG